MDDVIRKTQKMGYAETILQGGGPITGLDSRNHNIRS